METKVTINLDSYPLVRNMGFGKPNKLWMHPDRKLDFNVFLYIVSGYMEVWEEGCEYIIREGEIFFLKSGLHHWGELKTPPETSWYYIHFYDRPENSGHLLNYNSLERTDRLLKPENYNRFIILPKQMKIATPKLMVEKLDRLLNVYQSESTYRPFKLGTYTLELFLDLHKLAGTGKKISKSDVIVQKVVSYIEKSGGNHVNSMEISSLLKMNYSYISNIFKIKTGLNISEYATKLKVLEAAKMLRETNYNVTEVSNRTNFQNAYYFSRVFKKVMGISPSEYIKQIYRT